MLRIYVETSIPGYLAAAPSRDLVVAAHQQVTQEWWSSIVGRFDLFVSEAVLSEIRSGDPAFVERRLQFVQDLPILQATEEVFRLLDHYSEALGLSGRARADIPHLAYAVAHGLDFLVTWNCAHIANAMVIRRLHQVNQRLGVATPVIVTPEEFAEPFQGGLP